MSRVDTTSFAEILTRSLGQGANMAANAASLRQRREEAAAQQAMQQQQFAANEAQRAFSNDLATQRLGLDQLQFQTMTDRIAQEQAAEQEDRMMGGAVGASSGVFDQFIRLSAQQNGGTPAPDDLLRVRKWTEQGISTRALTTLRDAVQKGADLREIKAKTERLGGIVDNMMADPKNEKARPALELIKEMTLDPQTQGTAIREAFGVIQQQQAAQQAAAEQQQRMQLAGVVAGGGQLTPEQSLIVMDDPALRRMQEQANRPAPPDPQVVAQLFTRMRQGDMAARALLIQMGQLTPSAAFGGEQVDQAAFLRKQVEDRKAEYDFAMERAKAVGLFHTKDGTPRPSLQLDEIPDDPSNPQRQAYAALIQAERGLERSMANLRNAGQQQPSPQQGLAFFRELDARQSVQVRPETAQTYAIVKSQLTSQLGRQPTPDEMRAAMRQQLTQPQAQPR